MTWTYADSVNFFYPVTGARLSPAGIEVLRTAKFEMPAPHRANRGSIEMLSKQSLSRLAWTASNTPVKFKSMNTLTYGQNYPLSGKIVKDNLNVLRSAMRFHWPGFQYLWFMEFQERGAPHIHILSDIEASQKTRKKIADLWIMATGVKDWEYSELKKRRVLVDVDAVRSVHYNHRAMESEKKENGLRRYVVKYALKVRQKIVPQMFGNVGRFWGNSKGVKVPPGTYIDVTEQELRNYMERSGRSMENFDVLPKFLLVNSTQPRRNVDKHIEQ